MRYKEEYTKKVLASTDIVKIIGNDIALKKEGDVYIGSCPLHKSANTKDASQTLIVYPDKQVFHCFDCGKNGNAAVYLMEAKGITFSQAIDILAKKSGIVRTESDIQLSRNEVLKTNLYNVYRDAAIFYKQKLSSKEGEQAYQYLINRNLTPKTIENFALGYSPAKGNALYKYLSAKGYTDDVMQKAGLVKMSETGPYDTFRNRVMFPIIDENKKVVAFGGRVLSDEAKPKYLNSPESPIFNKSCTLYGLSMAPKVKQNYYILCEGNIDVIQLHQAGFKNAVATLGTGFTKMHVSVLEKYTNNLALSFDNDSAGQKAAFRAIGNLGDSNMGVRVISLSPCKDPDEFIQNFGAEEFENRVAIGMDKINFQLQYMAEKFNMNDLEQRKEFLHSAVDAIMKTDGRSFTPRVQER